jgi:hypothetical protein
VAAIIGVHGTPYASMVRVTEKFLCVTAALGGS